MEGPTVSQEDQDTITGLLEKLKQLEVIKGTEHPESIATVRELGEIYYRTRQFEHADRMFYRAFCGAERTHRKTHIIVYRVASIYGRLLIDTRKFDKAEVYLRKALVGLEGHLGLDHVDLLESMEGLGDVLYINKRQHLEFLQEAEVLFQRALAMRIKNYGKDDKMTLNAVNNVAKTLNALGQFDAAIVICQTTYDDCVALLGPLHPITLGAIEGLAFVLQAIGKYEQAMEMYRMSFAGNDSVLGKYHRSTIASLQHLAYLLQLSGTRENCAEAEERYMDALERNEEVEGASHPSTLGIMFKIGYLRKLQEKLVPAEEMLRCAMVHRNKEIGQLHPDTLCATYQLASVLYLQGLWKHVYGFEGKLREGFALFEDCIDKREKSLGLTHLDTIFAVDDYADCLAQQQLCVKAEYWFSVACRKLDEVVLASLNPAVAPAVEAAVNADDGFNPSGTLRTEQQWEAQEALGEPPSAGEHGYVYVVGPATRPPQYPRLAQVRPYSPSRRAVSPFRTARAPYGRKGTGGGSPVRATAVGGRPVGSSVVIRAAVRSTKLKPVPVPGIDRDHPKYSPSLPFNYYKYAASVAVKHGGLLQKLDRQPEAALVYKYALDLFHYFKCTTFGEGEEVRAPFQEAGAPAIPDEEPMLAMSDAKLCDEFDSSRESKRSERGGKCSLNLSDKAAGSGADSTMGADGSECDDCGSDSKDAVALTEQSDAEVSESRINSTFRRSKKLSAPRKFDINSEHIDVIIHETLSLYSNAMFMETL
jgi:tetratricopeptide (TPR) repeat protein